MDICVKLRCSECDTVREAVLKPDDKEIFCQVCARRMANLPEEDLEAIAAGLKQQRVMSIISIVLFVLAIVFVALWMGDSGKWTAQASKEADAGMFIGAAVCALASMIVGIIGSMKRYIVEF
jgi:hypothetical protein